MHFIVKLSLILRYNFVSGAAFDQEKSGIVLIMIFSIHLLVI